jgi:hypothetical protein
VDDAGGCQAWCRGNISSRKVVLERGFTRRFRWPGTERPALNSLSRT